MGEELGRTTVTDALVQRVLRLVHDDGLAAGDRLPSARALAERFAVAVPTVREALARLQATGAVQIHHGSGIYVGSTIEDVFLPNPYQSPVEGQRLVELLEARALIEPDLARRAARRRDTDSVRTLRRLLAEAGQHLEHDDDTLHRLNMRFHCGVAAASGNRVLAGVIEALASVNSVGQQEILRIFDDRARDHEEHREILAAIEAGRPGAAGTLMQRHLDHVRRVVADRLAADPAAGAS
ncbi:FadR/GntR family transcriptional regulator [Actinocatenispora rupis]|uniref:GntR family transcriptional regulator n=1 Tax=Actinocatenispora rupis TaxID=519421 RepID=A0A8J3IVQ5_9ACTN|nr:FCD domain-containing protein [Actinocatenispora rupis]GID09465.1 GntR family transcriptional regulator [Actinocatenispora rupis]